MDLKNLIISIITVCFLQSPATLAAKSEPIIYENVFLNLENILNTFEYYELDPVLRNLDQNEPHSKVFAQFIYIFHLMRIKGQVDPYIEDLGETLKMWETFPGKRLPKLAKTIQTIKNYYVYVNEKNSIEDRFSRASDIIMNEPSNYLEAWIQCTISIDSAISSFDILQSYDLEYLNSVCPKKYDLSHLPVSGNALLSIEQKFSMDMNNKITHELFNEAIKSENFYARVESYVALMSIGVNAAKTDLVLASREMISKLIADLSANGHTSLTLMYFDLMSDLTVKNQFADLIKDQEIHAKYNSLANNYIDVSGFIDQLSLTELGVLFLFLQNIEHEDVDLFAQLLEIEWQQFVANEDKKIVQVVDWFVPAKALYYFKLYELDDQLSALRMLEQLIAFHDDTYNAELESFEVNDIDQSQRETQPVAKYLNELASSIGDRLVDPGVYILHQMIGTELYYSNKAKEALTHLELAWKRMPESFKSEYTDSAEILSKISSAYSDIDNHKKASEYAEMTLETWVNIFKKNNNYLFTQEFEKNFSWRHSIEMAAYSVLFQQYEEEYGSEEYQRLDQLIFSAVQMLRMNRITFSTFNPRKDKQIDEISVLNTINKIVEDGNSNYIFEALYEPTRLLEKREFDLIKISEIKWEIPKDTMILMAYNGGSSTHFAQLGTGFIEPFFASIDTDELKQKINSLMDSVQMAEGITLQDFNFDSSTWIYDKIFSNEVSKHTNLSEIKNIIFLPSTETFNLPLGLLHNGKSEKISEEAFYYDNDEFLIDKVNISYFIDLNESLIKEVLSDYLKDKAQPIQVKASSFLGVGNPIYGELSATDYRAVSFVELNDEPLGEVEFSSLPETEDEIFEVSKYFDRTKSDILLGEHATKSNFLKQNLSSYDVLMFSTHGVNRDAIRGINDAALVFGWDAEKKYGTLDEILLHPDDIIHLDLNADLIILNACNSGLPNTSGAPGLTGIAQSFLAAGGEAIMVANWPISSKSTVELMSRMFGYLSTNSQASFNSALVYAQRSLKADEKTSHPFFWAPYSIYGNF